MTDTAIMTAFDNAIRAFHAWHVHVTACQRRGDCPDCTRLQNTKDAAVNDYEALAFGKPLPPQVPMAGAEDLVFLKQQAD
jgi:hypothetical protein